MNRNLKIILSILLFLVVLLLSSCQTISREEAIKITQDFVNQQVKFYVNQDNSTPVVEKASITIINTEKKQGNWLVYLFIQSDQTGSIKKSSVVVTVNSKNGEVLGINKLEQDINPE